MPSRPPAFRPAGWKPTEPWKQRPGPRVKRIRGRKGQRIRLEVLSEEPLCRLCLKEGRTAASTSVDHIKPLAFGGGNERTNLQGLCKPHHEAKSKAERETARGPRREPES